jgi:hypothetical protein
MAPSITVKEIVECAKILFLSFKTTSVNLTWEFRQNGGFPAFCDGVSFGVDVLFDVVHISNIPCFKAFV